MKRTRILFNIGIFLTSILVSSCDIHDRVKKEKFENLVGVYAMDTERTVYSKELRASSRDDSSALKLELKADSTFVFSKSVPYIYDSAGYWKTEGNYLGVMNEACFKSNGNVCVSFTSVYVDKKDTLFFFNSMTPKPNAIPIAEIYFRKIR